MVMVRARCGSTIPVRLLQHLFVTGVDFNNKYTTYPFSDRDAQEAISLYQGLKGI